MTDEVLEGLNRTESLLTDYLRDPNLGAKTLMTIRNPGDLRIVTVGLLAFINAQYKMSMVDALVAEGRSVEDSLTEVITNIHIAFMGLRNEREQELRGNNQTDP